MNPGKLYFLCKYAGLFLSVNFRLVRPIIIIIKQDDEILLIGPLTELERLGPIFRLCLAPLVIYQ